MATPGTGYWIVNDLMNLISNIVVEPVVSTTLGTSVVAGVQEVTPASMASIYQGAQLIVGTGVSQEVVVVTAVTDTTFIATFVDAHPATDVVFGATFPVCETTNPFFLQSEVLSYISDAQNVFLTRAPIVLAVTTQAFVSQQRISSTPDDCIQIQRVSVNGKNLWEQGQSSMDLLNKNWTMVNPTLPDVWYEDRVGFQKYGVAPVPGNTFTAELVYSQRDKQLLAINEGFLLPDPFLLYVMYGALAELFGKDGEQRDPARAQYCQKRFDLGVQVANRVFDNIMAQQTVNENG